MAIVTKLPSRRLAILVFATFVVLIVAIFLTSPRVLALYYLYWGRDSFKQLFYEGLGLGDNASSLLSTITAFFYGVAWIFYTAYVFALSRHFDVQKMLLGFIGFVFVYALAPLAHVVYSQFGPVVCFNQRTGQPQMWYVIRSGNIYIFDSPGFDATDGTQKLPVNSAICRAYELQRGHELPEKLSYERAYELPASNLWFWRTDKVLEVYDKPGLRPGTNDLLQPASSALLVQLNVTVERVKKQKQEAERQARIEQEAEAGRQADAEAKEHQRIRDEEAAQAKAAKDASDRQRAAAIEYLLARVAESKTGYECALDAAGVHFDADTVRFPDLHASANWLQWRASTASMANPDKTETALGVVLESSLSPLCVVFAVQPAPATLTADAAFTIDKVIGAISSLGVDVVQNRPPSQNPYVSGVNSPVQPNGAQFGVQPPGIIIGQPLAAYAPAGYGYGGRFGPRFYGYGFVRGGGRR